MVFRAILSLTFYDLLYRAGGLAGVLAWLRRARKNSSGTLSLGEIEAAISTALSLYPKRVLCLQCAVVRTRLLRSHGFAAETVVGYKTRPLQCHAWVEVDGRSSPPLEGYQHMMTVLYRA